MDAAINIKLSPDEADRLLDQLEDGGIPRGLFEELAEVFLKAYEETPRLPCA